MIARVTAIKALATTSLREALRDRILYGLLVFALGLILLSAVLSNLTLGFRDRIVTDLSLSAITVAGSLMAILLGVGSTARELERRTAYAILAKPLARADWIIGKYLGVLLTTVLNVGLMLVAATLMVLLYRDEGGFRFAWSAYLATLALLLLRIAVVAAMAVTLATFSSSTVAFIGSLAFTLAGYLTHELRFYLTRSESGFTRLTGDVLYYLLPDFAALDPLPRLIYGEPIATTGVLAAAAYAIAYSAGLLVVAVTVFHRRDLP